MTTGAGGYSYLEAAREVLRRYGKRMHYTSIARAAIRLGLLRTASQNPSLQMSVVISSDIQNNIKSDFRRIRRGVFELSEHSNAHTQLEGYEMLGRRIGDLATQLSIPDGVGVLKRALRVARECEDVKEARQSLRIGSSWFDFEPTQLCSAAVARTNRRDDSRALSVTLSRSLGAGYRAFARSLKVDLKTAVAYSVSVLETLLQASEGETVMVMGKGGKSASIWLY